MKHSELYGLCPPATTPLALRVWLYFEIECEKFDRTQPGFFSPRDPECWIPSGPEAPSVRFARELRERIRSRLPSLATTFEADREAQIIVSRMTYSQQVRLAEKLDAAAGEPFSLFPKVEFVSASPAEKG